MSAANEAKIRSEFERLVKLSFDGDGKQIVSSSMPGFSATFSGSVEDSMGIYAQVIGILDGTTTSVTHATYA
jgi:hypothetical protein